MTYSTDRFITIYKFKWIYELNNDKTNLLSSTLSYLFCEKYFYVCTFLYFQKELSFPRRSSK